MIRNRLLITLANFAAVGSMGLSVSILGPSLLLVRDFLRRDFEGAGLFTAGIQFGYALMGAVGGVLADRFRGDRVLTGGCLFRVLGHRFDFPADRPGVRVWGSPAVCVGSPASLQGTIPFPSQRGTKRPVLSPQRKGLTRKGRGGRALSKRGLETPSLNRPGFAEF